jgi:DNA primase
MKLSEQFEDARRTHDILTILGTNKRKIICPLPGHQHHENTPSFSIVWKKGVQWFRCHGNCGASGDVIDLVGYLRDASYDPHNLEQRKNALKMLDERYDISIAIPEKETVLYGDEWYHFLPIGPEALEYTRSRGLTDKTVNKFRIGQSGTWMSLPCFEEGRLQGIKLRTIDPSLTGDDRFRAVKGSRQGLFNIDDCQYSTGTVFVVKGEIPAMLLWQMGYKAVAPTGGEGGWRESWRTALALANKIVIGDNDVPGRIMGPKRAALMAADLVYPPQAFKDIDEYVLASPEEARRQLDRWASGV